MHVLLINPPNLDEPQIDARQIPLGLLHLRSYLTARGHTVTLTNLYDSRDWSAVRMVLRELFAPVVGIPLYTRQRFSVRHLISVWRALHPKSKVILGGPHASALDYEILRRWDDVDYVVKGEGEESFLRLIERLECSLEATWTMKGISSRNADGQVFCAPRVPRLKTLDDLPMPSVLPGEQNSFIMGRTQQFHFRRILDHCQSTNNYYRLAPVSLSRGCSEKCRFCSVGSFWESQRYFSPQYTHTWINIARKELDTPFFFFHDDNFSASKKYVKALCDLVLRSKLDLKWWCLTRAETVDSESLLAMRRAGCFMVSFGLESGCPEMLKRMGKRQSVEGVVESARLARAAGLAIRCTVSVGNIGESMESIHRTIDALRRIRPTQVGAYIVKLYPGTPLYADAKRRGEISDAYWFDPRKPAIPYYTDSRPAERLLEFQSVLREGLLHDASVLECTSGGDFQFEFT